MPARTDRHAEAVHARPRILEVGQRVRIINDMPDIASYIRLELSPPQKSIAVTGECWRASRDRSSLIEPECPDMDSFVMMYATKWCVPNGTMYASSSWTSSRSVDMNTVAVQLHRS